MSWKIQHEVCDVVQCLRKNKRVSVYMFRRLNCHPWQFALTVQYFIATSSGIHKTIGPNLLTPVFWSFMATQGMDKILPVQAKFYWGFCALVQRVYLKFKEAEKQTLSTWWQNTAAFKISKLGLFLRKKLTQWSVSLQNSITNPGNLFWHLVSKRVL